MRPIYAVFLFAFFALSSCVKEQDLALYPEEVVVVNGFLKTQKTMDELKIQNLKEVMDGAQYQGVMEASLDVEGDFFDLVSNGDGQFQFEDDSKLIEPDTWYSLTIDYRGEQYTANTRTPPILDDITFTKTVLNSELAFDQIDVTMVGDENHDIFYYVTIKPLAEELIPVESLFVTAIKPRDSFISKNSNVVSLLLAYFRYYGPHEITVQRINRDYLELFEKKINERYYMIDGNVENGKGMFIGSDQIQFNVTIE